MKNADRALEFLHANPDAAVRMIHMGDELARSTILRTFVGEQLLRGRKVCVVCASTTSAGIVRRAVDGVHRGRLTCVSVNDNPSGIIADLLVLDSVQSPDSALKFDLLEGRIRNVIRTIKPVQVVALYLPAHSGDAVRVALGDWGKEVVGLDLTS